MNALHFFYVGWTKEYFLWYDFEHCLMQEDLKDEARDN